MLCFKFEGFASGACDGSVAVEFLLWSCVEHEISGSIWPLLKGDGQDFIEGFVSDFA
jgi:hypothetical protein